MTLKKYIPDAITSLNLLCGTVGVVFAFKGRFDLAFYLMLMGAVFDFCDGLAARALGAYSDFGKELDSLSDMVTFGLLPSVLMYKMMTVSTFSDCIWCYIPLVIAVMSGLRLAKFNVDERQHDSFIGLATPACAMICGSLCYFIAHDSGTFLAAWAAGYVFLPLVSVALSALLVCEIPMFSFKNSDKSPLTRRKRLFFLVDIVIIVAIVATLGLNWSLVMLMSMIVYILLNVVFAIFKI